MTTLITGGTGSFGTAFVEFLLTNTTEKIRVFSRDEHKQEKLSRRYPPDVRLSYCLGDVRDIERLKVAMDGVETVIHAAALKTVPAGERHASEFVKTNIDGTANVITAAIARGVAKTLFISSDKAVQPINLYGKTKAVAESLIVQANTLGANSSCRFAVVRGGNVWGSAGSVIPLWREKKQSGDPILITDLQATRFHLEMKDWTRFVYSCAQGMTGGEIFIPHCRAWNLKDLATAFDHNSKVIGARSGDKLHETLIAPDELDRVFVFGRGYAIAPNAELRRVMQFDKITKFLTPDELSKFSYSSDRAERLTPEALRSLINEK